MTTFLLLHGIPGCASTWSRVGEALAAAGHHVISPDLAGFGPHADDARREALLAPAQAGNLLARLDRSGVGHVVLAGHDFGGPVAAHLIAMAPDRVDALALFATNVFPDTHVPFPLSLVTTPVIGSAATRLLFSRSSLRMMIRRGIGEPNVAIDPEHLIGSAHQRRAIEFIFVNSLRRLNELYTPVRDALASVTVPTLVGWGDRDPFFPLVQAERTAALIAAARLQIYAGAGHFLPDERPDLLAADLLELAVMADHSR